MSYSITLKTYQTSPNVFFVPVENTIWNYANGGTWLGGYGADILTMGGSGTSGIVRFASDPETLTQAGENFAVVMGVHNNARWCDIITDIPSTQTATTLHPAYYTTGTPQTTQREKQSTACAAKAKNGRTINVTYTVATGNALKANIIIG